MDTSENTEGMNSKLMNIIQQAQEETIKEFMNLPVKERDISDLNEKTLIKIQEKIEKVRLKKLKRGIKI